MDANINGPRLGTKLFILMSLALLVIPWFSYRYLSEMESFLVESQSHAQLLTAEGISTLLNGRKDLFYDLPISPEGYRNLQAHPLENPIRIDGKDSDWETIIEHAVTFSVTEIADEVNPEGPQSSFKLILGEHKDQIYALLKADDETIVYRDRDILRLDLSDHIRLTFPGQGGNIEKLVITMAEPGVSTAYAMDEEWRHAISGDAENRIQGFMTEVAGGYVIEFRVPLAMLSSERHFGLAVIDVDDVDEREIKSINATLPSAGREASRLIVLKSPEVLRIVEGLGYSGASIQVIDAQGRVRAEVGSYNPEQIILPEDDETSWTDFWSAMISFFLDSIYSAVETARREDIQGSEDLVIKDSLKGKPSFQRRYDEREGETIIAAHPIIAEGEIIGTVVLKQNTDRILQLRKEALQRIISFSVAYLFIFVILILAFSVTLARRIRKLGAETTNAIDAYGRLQTNKLKSETGSGDEIGDLARSISAMLSKLHQHTQFLENMPRTLRHEINNPLNTLSTSLQNLESESSEIARRKYLESAKRGVMRIGLIIQNLADAANLEEALESEELELVDLQKLVQSYIVNCRTTHPNQTFEYNGTNYEVLAKVSDYRIEQLLDKLVDNAVDFTDPGSKIIIGLSKDSYNLTLFVSNQGPSIPTDMFNNIFDSMVSVRSSHLDNRLHFGMGLYVVRVIAQHHGGNVSASNLLNGRGVSVRVSLPLYRPMDERSAATG
ncbi:MAG: hypothetical protein CMQ17_02915 [Gammaproteobacteria bacterium]|nr:hypothetical protein [Gammaproteobacteria bacterium]MDP7146085.1 ATP-binding protein [Pseudomonadales bacterium]